MILPLSATYVSWCLDTSISLTVCGQENSLRISRKLLSYSIVTVIIAVVCIIHLSKDSDPSRDRWDGVTRPTTVTINIPHMYSTDFKMG